MKHKTYNKRNKDKKYNAYNMYKEHKKHETFIYAKQDRKYKYDQKHKQH